MKSTVRKCKKSLSCTGICLIILRGFKASSPICSLLLNFAYFPLKNVFQNYSKPFTISFKIWQTSPLNWTLLIKNKIYTSICIIRGSLTLNMQFPLNIHIKFSFQNNNFLKENLSKNEINIVHWLLLAKLPSGYNSLFELQFNEEILRETHCTVTFKSITPL